MSGAPGSEISFDSQLQEYKELIDAEIDEYCQRIEKATVKTYGLNSEIVTEAFTGLLKRGGKRIRGALTMVGYEMCGGVEQDMIIKAACAIEMMHVYVLIIDDIQDRSEVRRGGPTAHMMLETAHGVHKWEGSAAHTGVALALNASLLGSHGAQLIFANLTVPEELRLKALNIMNHTIIVTAHGQSHDIINEVSSKVSFDEIDKTMQWKTAHYSVLNPLHMGMVLADGPCDDTNAITRYALNAGKLFQVSDDLLVVSKKRGADKDAMDDIREGKKTLLTTYAMQNAKPADAQFLKSSLGNPDIDKDDLKRTQDILVSSGAADYAKKMARQYADAAHKALHEHADRWNSASVTFLDEFVGFLLDRVDKAGSK